ncbi:ABC transporter permease [Quadrisphaera sp. INWT6]|uniref:ABC transporter permease n=1 Tax=Quadrisphaera sp. INWT6 TaxID=2596917 RepID=UPI0018922827|nr:ABC transporter permease [Quadrisphaera sp. INWT6]MBF5083069.1 ABC transporter permease subunit [Quadrisphaera sp. INWT6]
MSAPLTSGAAQAPATGVLARAPRAVPTRGGFPAALRAEATKLTAQLRAKLLLAACLVVPPVVVAGLAGQRPPSDTIYGRWVHESGYADSLLLLGFAAQWVLPLVASLVAGDTFAGEEAHGTWKTLLTRSVSRSHVFWAKCVLSAVVSLLALLLMAVSATVAGMLLVGTQPLVGLSGQTVGSTAALELVAASWALAAAPLLAMTAIALLLSARVRNPAVGVVGPVVIGLLMTLLGAVGGTHLLRRALPTTAFESWHGLFAAPAFTGPVWQGLLTCAVWTVVCLLLARVHLVRRDITGG